MPRLVIQLERIGDLAQSLAALPAPGEHPAELLVREDLLSLASRLVRGPVTPRAIEPSALGELLRACEQGAGVGAAARAAARSVGAAPEVLLNLTYHRAAAALASALRPAEAWGPLIGRRGERLSRGIWSCYPLAAVDARPSGRVHMIDVRRLQSRQALGVRALPPRPAEARTVPGRRVGLALGAGDPARRPPTEWLRALARALTGRGHELVLLGGAGEAELGRALAAELGNAARSAAGEVSLGDLPDLLTDLAAVVGADTGPVHVACALGVPVVMILAGGAHVWETGPWGEGDLAVQCLPVGASAPDAAPPDAIAACIDSRVAGELPGLRPNGGSWRLLQARWNTPHDPLDGLVYSLPGADPPPEDLAVRGLLAALTSSDGAPGPAAEILPAAAGLGPLADSARAAAHAAERALDGPDPGDALPALRQLSQLAPGVLQQMSGRADLRLAGCLLEAAISSLPDDDPRAVVRAHRRLLDRLVQAFEMAREPCAAV